MSERDIKAFAKGIAELKDVVSDEDRLRFARVIRDVCQFSKNWPGSYSFEKMCDITLPGRNAGISE